MSEKLFLQIRLLSDATFGRGDGVAGLIDVEVEHDPRLGLPFIRGRVIKGLLVEECANILFALEKQNNKKLSEFKKAADFLFGHPGSTMDTQAALQIGPASLPDKLVEAVDADIKAGRLKPADVLDALTGIRRQTAVDDTTGAPSENSLRTNRVMLRDLQLTSVLNFDTDDLNDHSKGLLAACVMALRRGGMGRNRGRGEIETCLLAENSKDQTPEYYGIFKKSIQEGKA